MLALPAQDKFLVIKLFSTKGTLHHFSIDQFLHYSDIREAQLRASRGDSDGEGLVVPLLLQNKPPTVEGREDDELADVELRPEQVSPYVHMHAFLLPIV